MRKGKKPPRESDLPTPDEVAASHPSRDAINRARRIIRDAVPDAVEREVERAEFLDRGSLRDVLSWREAKSAGLSTLVLSRDRDHERQADAQRRSASLTASRRGGAASLARS